jgi:AraC-like DNA-binding protein
MVTNTLSFVNAAVTTPIIAAFPGSASRAERLAETCGLQPSIVAEQSGFVPLHAVEQFLSALQGSAGNPLFLYRSLDFERATRASTVANIILPNNLTGVEAMQALARTFSSQLVGAEFFCAVTKDRRVWVQRTAATTEWTNNWPVQQYNLRAVLDGVRFVLGYRIAPVAARLGMLPSPSERPEDLRHIPIDVNPTTMGLAFDLADVVRARPFSSIQPPRSSDHVGARGDGPTTLSITACLSNYICNTATDCSAERTARAFGMSDRTYRRRLKELGTKHSELVSNARLSLALRMLQDHSLSVTQIALELGYSHQGDFTRFFIRRVGISPTEYRRLQRD